MVLNLTTSSNFILGGYQILATKILIALLIKLRFLFTKFLKAKLKCYTEEENIVRKGILHCLYFLIIWLWEVDLFSYCAMFRRIWMGMGVGWVCKNVALFYYILYNADYSLEGVID